MGPVVPPRSLAPGTDALRARGQLHLQRYKRYWYQVVPGTDDDSQLVRSFRQVLSSLWFPTWLADSAMRTESSSKMGRQHHMC